MSLREKILSTHYAIKDEPVTVPEWGETVYVRAMSSADRDQYESEMIVIRGKNVDFNRKNIRARLLVKTLVDAEGKRIFTDADAEKLGSHPASVLDPLFDVAQKVNRLSEKDVEELAGN